MRLRFLLLLLLLPIASVRAQGDIHRCMGANGVPVFTDRVCSDLNAAPVLPAPTATPAPASPTAPPPAVLCATDVAHLKQAVIDAFADRNPNRLAGLMLWNGDGQQTVVADIRAFNQLMAHPLIGVTVSGGADDEADPDATEPAPAASTDDAAAHGESLLVQTESDDGSGSSGQTRFEVIHHAGCLWLHPRE